MKPFTHAFDPISHRDPLLTHRTTYWGTNDYLSTNCGVLVEGKFYGSISALTYSQIFTFVLSVWEVISFLSLRPDNCCASIRFLIHNDVADFLIFTDAEPFDEVTSATCWDHYLGSFEVTSSVVFLSLIIWLCLHISTCSEYFHNLKNSVIR